MRHRISSQAYDLTKQPNKRWRSNLLQADGAQTQTRPDFESTEQTGSAEGQSLIWESVHVGSERAHEHQGLYAERCMVNSVWGTAFVDILHPRLVHRFKSATAVASCMHASVFFRRRELHAGWYILYFLRSG